MAEQGHIIEINGNIATISMTRSEACGDCKACDKGSNSKEMIMEAFNECNGKIGDIVKIELQIEKQLHATFVLYLIPLITMMLGFTCGKYLFHKDILSFFVGLLFLGVTYFAISAREKRRNKENYIPVAKEIVVGAV